MMGKSREIEAKVLLTKLQYSKIITDYPKKADFIQSNYYFDTPSSFLKTHFNSLRIRIYSDHAEQTLKVPDPKKIQNNYHEVIEISDNLSKETAEKIVTQAKNNDYINFRENIGQYFENNYHNQASNLQLLTWSQTKRILLKGPKACELTADQTKYPDNYVDYELEIENSDPRLIQSTLDILAKKYNLDLNLKYQNKSKIGRAYEHRNKTK